MTIHFTEDGVYADTEEERNTFYDQMLRGDPVIWGHIQIHNMQLEANKRQSKEEEK